MRNVCIVGAGAVGGVLGARLAASGVRTAALARGATLDALRTHGWRLREGAAGEIVTAPAVVSDDPAELGVQDLVVLSVKATALVDAVRALPPLLGPHTTVLTAMNGVPWWFFAAGAGVPAELRGLRLRAVDPDGSVAAAVPADRVLGGVVHYSASVVEPGFAARNAGRELIIGEPDGSRSDRATEVTALLTAAGFATTLSDRIQADVWYKLWGNMTMNPVSVLTGATSDLILDDPLVHEFCVAVMREAAEVGDRIGCHIDETPADRMVVTRKLGAMTTSMLQDARSGRPIELDALVGAVREIAAAVGVATPHTDALHGLARLNGRTRGLYP
ncbi:2-dehydropantoate 2-reductase [Cryptosporangium aurantiacum]|uniref:Ketopantoate reductase n=1 Tax=Cryptosporangium aurantiacum TaxID=134849 RepID=A0A1M7R6F7_9ACTN|nr:2-dehydropantoate 2-reductase [Cryptosporangium aurantiacum]SHN41925.1 ketopantoate reductase [Cryptosporangium aurantiacum]